LLGGLLLREPGGGQRSEVLAPGSPLSGPGGGLLRDPLERARLQGRGDAVNGGGHLVAGDV